MLRKCVKDHLTYLQNFRLWWEQLSWFQGVSHGHWYCKQRYWWNLSWFCWHSIYSFVDEDKLVWAFRLYDMDNNGVIDIDEMANIIETLDAIEGVKPGQHFWILIYLVINLSTRSVISMLQVSYNMMKMVIQCQLRRLDNVQRNYLM